MDYRSGVTAHARAASSAQQAVVAEQAIFTSMRTPMGEGYRLVAMSPGITAEERAEITRRSPSHGSICDPDPAAWALSSYALATKRQCVAWTRYAGREHTARGGQRVHTHLVVVEPTGFEIFAGDPFRVCAAMRCALGEAPNLKPAACLETLSLDAGGQDEFRAGGQDQLHWACRAAAEALQHEAVLVAGADCPLELLKLILAVLPQGLRTHLAVSANLQYAASRQMRLACVGRNTPEQQRLVQGRQIYMLDTTVAPYQSGSAYDGWFDFVLERGKQGRLGEIVALASGLIGQIDPAVLSRVAEVARDVDRVEHAGQGTLEQLVTRYADLTPLHPLEKRLAKQLLSAAVRRAAVLSQAQV